jgi:DNA-binding PadR family transcriptional regulator
MDIQHAILGILSWQPFSGYDIKRIISESDLFYWSGNNNQIYYSLVQLHQAELVTQEIQHQESLPTKKKYTITEKGRVELRKWILANPELPEFRNNFLIQLAWADQLSQPELDDLLGRYEDEIEIQLRMRQAGDRIIAPDQTGRAKFLWKKIFENILATYQHELEWIRAVRRELRDANFADEN